MWINNKKSVESIIGHNNDEDFYNKNGLPAIYLGNIPSTPHNYSSLKVVD